MEPQQVSSWALKRRDLNTAERQLAYFCFFWFVCSHVVPQHILGDDKAHTSCLPVGHHFNRLFGDCSYVSIETIWRGSPDNSHKFISNGVSSPTLLYWLPAQSATVEMLPVDSRMPQRTARHKSRNVSWFTHFSPPQAKTESATVWWEMMPVVFHVS